MFHFPISRSVGFSHSQDWLNVPTSLFGLNRSTAGANQRVHSMPDASKRNWTGYRYMTCVISVRHSGCREGVDLRTVKELLGHSSITTTMTYAHFAPNHASRSILEAQNLEIQELAGDA